MPLFIIYLIKANIALVIFYLAYRFGLRRLTFYTLNRLFLLFGIAFSITFPLVNVNSFFSHHEKLAGGVIYYAPDWQALQQYWQPESFTWWNFAEYLFWAGFTVMAVRFFMQLFSLWGIHLRTTDGYLFKEKVRLMNDRINPFSFFKNIYINPALHSKKELKSILMHERIHVKSWHSADIIASELNHIFYWFNPGAWLMKTAIRENLEFITDRKILQSGMDVKTYQYSLLKVSSIPFAVPIANNFNFSHLKQRIRMMNKKSSSHYHILHYLLLLPVIAGIVLVVTSSQGQNSDEMKSAEEKYGKFPVPSSNQYREDTIPNATIQKNVKSPSDEFLTQNPSVKMVGLGGAANKKPTVLIVWLKNGSRKTFDMNNAGEKEAAENLYGREQVKNLFKNAKTSGSDTNPNEKPIVVQGYSLYATRAYQAAKEKDYNKATALAKKALQADPGNSEAKQVLRYVHQMKAYDQRLEEYKHNKNETRIIVDTVYPDHHVTPGVNPKVKYTPPKAIVDTAISYNNSNSYFHSRKEPDMLFPKNTLYVLNNKEVGIDKIQQLSPENIQSVSVVKGQEAVSLYGEKGKNGVIRITTKPKTVTLKSDEKYHPMTSSNTTQTIDTAFFTPAGRNLNSVGSNPIYILNNKVIDKATFKSISPADIKSITILKDSSALSAYGKKGTTGVIKITTK